MRFASRHPPGKAADGGRPPRARAAGRRVAAFVLALAFALPALAQPYGQAGYGRGAYGRGGYATGGYGRGGYGGGAEPEGYARPQAGRRADDGMGGRRGPPAPPRPAYGAPYSVPGRGPRPGAPYGFPAAPEWEGQGRAPLTGGFLPPDVRGPPILDFARFHLRRPPRGYFWFRDGGFYVLASASTGVVFEVIPADGY